jgi:alkaline phosphatase D
MIMEGLKESGLPVNVIIASDHGMQELKKNPDNYIFLSNLLNRSDTTVRVSNGGTQAHIYARDKSKVDSIFRTIVKNPQKYSVLRQSDFPDRWHYKTSRAGDLLITAAPGFYIVDQEPKTFLSKLQIGNSSGVHGYDPHVAVNMRGIFYAIGPNIKPQTRIRAFENIHIYPLMAEILGLPIPPIDGKLDVLKPILVR